MSYYQGGEYIQLVSDPIITNNNDIVLVFGTLLGSFSLANMIAPNLTEDEWNVRICKIDNEKCNFS